MAAARNIGLWDVAPPAYGDFRSVYNCGMTIAAVFPAAWRTAISAVCCCAVVFLNLVVFGSLRLRRNQLRRKLGDEDKKSACIRVIRGSSGFGCGPAALCHPRLHRAASSAIIHPIWDAIFRSAARGTYGE